MSHFTSLRSPAPAARRGALLGLCASLLVAGPLAGSSAFAADASPAPSASAATALSVGGRYILRLAPGSSAEDVSSAVRALGAAVVAVQAGIGTIVVQAPAGSVSKLAGLSGVAGVAPDATMHPQSLDYQWWNHPGSMTNVNQDTGAQQFWKAGFTGKGVDVAVIDTGIAPVPGLKDADKVVVGPDLSFESQNDRTRFLDSYGHGTNMAGIIAGREGGQKAGTVYADDQTNFLGMAPDARLISVKMADRGGAVDVSQMIAAIDWVVQHKYSDGLNIKVLNISYGTLSRQDAQADPLSWAAEVAWKQGITVVASAGNDGDSTVGLASPAYNPWVIAVGASDSKGSMDPNDDTVPSFSERGVDGGRGPDLVAPGVGIISLAVPGSSLYDSYPGARVGSYSLRGSGTSQAAAVVSGAAALVLTKWPWLSPEEVKHQLTSSAVKLGGVSSAAQGAGVLNLWNALGANPQSGGQNFAAGNGLGSIEKARGGRNLTMDGVALTGEVDIFGNNWTPTLSQQAGWLQAWTWDGWFNGSQYTGAGFVSDTTSWAGKTWQGKTWQGKTWQGKTWQGKTWQGKTWQTGSWTGQGWSSASWGSAASTPSWAGKVWSSAAWN
jgi:serine protease AprX